jgi:hypothetical protein
VGLVVLAACAGKKSASMSGKNWVVLPEKEALVLTRPCSRSFPPNLTGYWSLGQRDIERAEQRFGEALRRELARLLDEDREGSPGLWYAQYAGFFRNGRKVIYVNAVGAAAVDGQWRNRAIRICDGGLISFGAVLDLDRDAVDSFEFDGTMGGRIRTRGSPKEWFDASFLRLQQIGPVSTRPVEWRSTETRDGLVFRLDAAYRVRTDGCWEKSRERWPGPGWRDLCINRTAPEMAEHDFRFHLRPAVSGDARAEPSDDPEMTDIVLYDSWRAEAASLGGRRAIVERARANGGMAGYKRQRTMNALIELAQGDYVRFSARTGDDDGYDELLAIAATVESGAPRRR